MFTVFCAALAAICIGRGICCFKLPRRAKFLLSALVVLLAFNLVLQLRLPREWLPTWAILTFAFGYSVLVLYDIFLIGYEALYWSARGVWHLRRREFPERFWRPVRAVLLIPPAVIAVCGMMNALDMPRVREYDLTVAGLPPELDGMTVAHLTDIHSDRIVDRRRVQAIVDRVNALHPDLTVVVGDIVDRRVRVHGDTVRPLGDLRAKYGVYGVPGNHEYYAGYAEWMEFFNAIGVVMLENRHVLIADGRIALGGVTDPAAERFGMEEPDPEKAFAGAPSTCMKLLLAHQPKVAAKARAAGVSLQLSGHTHGGMVRGLDLIIAGANMGMVSGEYDYHGMKVFVSNGAGQWNGFPVRLGRDSEIVLLRLRVAKGK
ncbi:MAG: metallophosphoesterase [Lentisphaeria bacterium]|nr:metallophosphoesterase [Lentisphaeria bacterium]